MVAPLQSDYSNKKGIYKNLYREIDSNNKKRELSQAKKPKKGIYVELYKQIEFKNTERKNESNNLYVLAFKKLIGDVCSKLTYFFAAATSEVKMLILACMVAKKSLNDYIDNSVQNSNAGSYYNGR